MCSQMDAMEAASARARTKMGKRTGKQAFSRRGFLEGASAMAGAAASSSARETVVWNSDHKAPEPRRISEHLFVFEDTCNVYILRDGDHAALIDFGSGAVLRHLEKLGIHSVDWILHTHHHRDQAQGDGLGIAAGIPIAVPAHERHLFAEVEDFWKSRRIFELYSVQNNLFSLTRNVPVERALRDYDTFQWRGYDIFIQPTPGHTPGSITLMVEIDGMKTAFSGDLIQSPGKVQTLYDLQYQYGEHEGADLSVYSLNELIKLKPALVCPSHGTEMRDPEVGLRALAAKLGEWFLFWHPAGSRVAWDFEPVEITPHVLAHPQATSTFYAILSRSGKALLIDYGCASWSFFQSFLNATGVHDRIRFVEHGLDLLRTRYGVKSFDVAIASHIHDDHVNGFPHLARRYGTKIWCLENMVEIFENPHGRALGCILGEPLKIDRALKNNETFRWEEYEFQIVHSPGHTEYEAALFTTIDGKRLAFTGDAFFHDAVRPQAIRHNLIFRNDVRVGDYLKSIQNVLDFNPEILAPGHGEPFAVSREMALGFAEKVRRQDDLFRALIADEDTDVGLDPAWVQICPYQSTIIAGESRSYEFRVRNRRRRAIKVELAAVLPEAWRSTPRSITLHVDAGGNASAPFQLSIPTGWTGQIGRVAISAEVSMDEKPLGQLAEAVIDVRPGSVKVD